MLEGQFTHLSLQAFRSNALCPQSSLEMLPHAVRYSITIKQLSEH